MQFLHGSRRELHIGTEADLFCRAIHLKVASRATMQLYREKYVTRADLSETRAALLTYFTTRHNLKAITNGSQPPLRERKGSLAYLNRKNCGKSRAYTQAGRKRVAAASIGSGEGDWGSAECRIRRGSGDCGTEAATQRNAARCRGRLTGSLREPC
jgi:hypothetical protein